MVELAPLGPEQPQDRAGRAAQDVHPQAEGRGVELVHLVEVAEDDEGLRRQAVRRAGAGRRRVRGHRRVALVVVHLVRARQVDEPLGVDARRLGRHDDRIDDRAVEARRAGRARVDEVGQLHGRDARHAELHARPQRVPLQIDNNLRAEVAARDDGVDVAQQRQIVDERVGVGRDRVPVVGVVVLAVAQRRDGLERPRAPRRPERVLEAPVPAEEALDEVRRRVVVEVVAHVGDAQRPVRRIRRRRRQQVAVVLQGPGRVDGVPHARARRHVDEQRVEGQQRGPLAAVHAAAVDVQDLREHGLAGDPVAVRDARLQQVRAGLVGRVDHPARLGDAQARGVRRDGLVALAELRQRDAQVAVDHRLRVGRVAVLAERGADAAQRVQGPAVVLDGVARRAVLVVERRQVDPRLDVVRRALEAGLVQVRGDGDLAAVRARHARVVEDLGVRRVPPQKLVPVDRRRVEAPPPVQVQRQVHARHAVQRVDLQGPRPQRHGGVGRPLGAHRVAAHLAQVAERVHVPRVEGQGPLVGARRLCRVDAALVQHQPEIKLRPRLAGQPLRDLREQRVAFERATVRTLLHRVVEERQTGRRQRLVLGLGCCDEHG